MSPGAVGPGSGRMLRNAAARVLGLTSAMLIGLAVATVALQGVRWFEGAGWYDIPVGAVVGLPQSGILPLQDLIAWIGGRPAWLFLLLTGLIGQLAARGLTPPGD